MSAQHTPGRLRPIRAAYRGQFRDQRVSNLTNNSERREMKCWDVVNEAGAVMRGGLIKGSNINWTSDRPVFPTRKAAQEWINECAASANRAKTLADALNDPRPLYEQIAEVRRQERPSGELLNMVVGASREEVAEQRNAELVGDTLNAVYYAAKATGSAA
jgi:hypothetical protein